MILVILVFAGIAISLVPYWRLKHKDTSRMTPEELADHEATVKQAGALLAGAGAAAATLAASESMGPGPGWRIPDPMGRTPTRPLPTVYQQPRPMIAPLYDPMPPIAL